MSWGSANFERHRPALDRARPIYWADFDQLSAETSQPGPEPRHEADFHQQPCLRQRRSRVLSVAERSMRGALMLLGSSVSTPSGELWVWGALRQLRAPEYCARLCIGQWALRSMLRAGASLQSSSARPLVLISLVPHVASERRHSGANPVALFFLAVRPPPSRTLLERLRQVSPDLVEVSPKLDRLRPNFGAQVWSSSPPSWSNTARSWSNIAHLKATSAQIWLKHSISGRSVASRVAA